MTPRTPLALLTISLMFPLLAQQGPIQAQDPAQPMFSTGVAVVPITALVRDSRNRIVRNLVRDDFQVLEQGRPRPIVEFRAKDDAAVSVAFLFDTSGSMRLALNLEKGIWFIEHFLEPDGTGVGRGRALHLPQDPCGRTCPSRAIPARFTGPRPRESVGSDVAV